MSTAMFLSLYFGLPLALLLAPLLLRNRWLLAVYVVVVGGGLAVLHLWDQSIKSQPDFVDGAGGAALDEAMLRRTSAVRALLVVLLIFVAEFTLLSLLFVGVPNWQWRWRALIEFAENVGGYFLLAWILASADLLAYPLVTRSRESRGGA